jgi:hypothetical protein
VGVISHLSVVNITPDDLVLYDETDTHGQMVNVTDLMPPESAPRPPLR